MAGEREATIKISAKDLTKAEFAKVQKGLKGLDDASGATTKKVSGLQRGFSSFARSAPGALKIVTGAALATGAAIAGIAVAVVKLGQRGAVVGDVKSAFEALSVSAGETGSVMLGALQQGVKGTISNFDLMKVANKALGTGLLKTSDDARTLAEGARLLAKRTGGDTAQAFETLTTAMASGRTAQLKQIGLFVDNKQAVEDFAKAQGKSVSQLNDADRATALQIATMAALRKELEGFPPPLSDFGELIEAGSASLTNLNDDVSLMISNSPVLLSGMQAAATAVAKAFGKDNQGLALSLVNIIERAAITAIDLGLAGIDAAGGLARGFAGIKVLVLGVAVGITEVQKTLAGFVATTLEMASKVPVLGAAYGAAAVAVRSAGDGIEALNASLKLQVEEAAIAAAGNDALGIGLTTLRGVLVEVQTGMVNAGLSQRQLTQATIEGASAVTNLGTAVGAAKSQVESILPVLENWKPQLVDMGAASSLFADTTVNRFGDMTIATNFFGVSMDVVAARVASDAQGMQAAFAKFGLNTRAEMNKTHQEFVKAFELIKESGEKTAKELEEIWAAYEESRREATAQTEEFQFTSGEAVAEGAKQIFNVLGEKFKAASIAAAIIATYQAIAKALASAPWPASLVLAAGAAAAGFANVAKIRSAKAFQQGTLGLDFQDFGRSSAAVLHGREAVIPQGGGHQLAAEIAQAMGGRGRGLDPAELRLFMTEFSAALRAEFSGLSSALHRAVRDGVLLAK